MWVVLGFLKRNSDSYFSSPRGGIFPMLTHSSHQILVKKVGQEPFLPSWLKFQ